ncbi:MAG: peptidylprolyl isomerase [Clostridia bacterium]|nr:peptidylprolyl isomerase [Clostridia bacterium]
MVKIEMENGGVIELELYPETAPITVKNFEKLVSEGFYDGLIFHRVISGFMIQGGDPTGTGYHGSDENIKGEFLANGVMNKLSHTRGVISMARSQHPDSASSQFFICHEDAVFLDGNYAAFGKVTKGMDVVDAIAEVDTDGRDKPYEDQIMKKVTLV